MCFVQKVLVNANPVVNMLVISWTSVKKEKRFKDCRLIARRSSIARRFYYAFNNYNTMTKTEDHPTQTNNII